MKTPQGSYEPIAPEEDQLIDIRKLKNKLLGLWPWALMWAAILGIGAIVWLYFFPLDYTTSSAILIKDNVHQKAAASGTDETLQTVGLASAANVFNELQVLQSRSLMERVVTDMQLNVGYFYPSLLKSQEIYGHQVPFSVTFFTFREDSLKMEEQRYTIRPMGNKRFALSYDQGAFDLKAAWGDTVSLPAGRAVFLRNPAFGGNEMEVYGLRVSATNAAIAELRSGLTLEMPDKMSTVVNISLSQPLAVKGEAILNRYIKDYIQLNIEDKNKVADSTLLFLNERLATVAAQLNAKEAELQHFKQSNNVADLSAQSQALIQNNSEYARLLTNQQVQLSVINSLQNYILKENKDNPRLVPASLAVQDPMLTSIINQYNSLLLQKSRMTLSATENNPMVINLDQQIAQLRGDLINGIASVKRSAEVALSQLNSQKGNMEYQMRQVPGKERKFLDYSREQSVLQELYLFLLQKREEAAISRSSSIANIRVISAPKASPEPLLITILLIGGAVFVGLLIPFGYVFLRDHLDSRIISKTDLERHTRLPVIGEIGHNAAGADVVVDPTTQSIIAEQFRSLRTNLQYILTNANEKTLLVTSSMRDEGKSFIALNLAITLALTGKKVVLVDFDLRNPQLSDRLSLSGGAGVTDFLIENAACREIIQPSGIHPHLSVVSAGSIPPNPAELIMSDATSRLFGELRESFDFVIVDTTPHVVTDAQLLSRFADATLYVVRMNHTRKEQLKIVNSIARNDQANNLNLIVNDIRQKRFGQGYYGYGYGMEYGYYMREEKRKKKQQKKQTRRQLEAGVS